MKEDVAKQIKYRGYKINIYRDNDCQSPDEWGDDGLFLVGYHRDFSVDRGQRGLVRIFKRKDFKKDNGYNGRVYADGYGWKNYAQAKKEGLIDKEVRQGAYVPGISKHLAQCIANSGLDPETGETNEEAKDYIKKYHIFGLEAYIHSGVVLALSREGNFVDRQWDVSQLGLVFVSKKETQSRKKAHRLALGLIEGWNDYLSGNVYGFLIEDPFGEESCGSWGFYGNYETSGLISEAKAEIVNALKEDKKLDHVAIGASA